MENERRQDKQDERDDVSVALIRQDLKYVRSDIADIKDQLKREQQNYVSRSEIAALLAERDRDIRDLKSVQASEKERATFYSRTIIVTALGAALSLIVTLYTQAHK